MILSWIALGVALIITLALLYDVFTIPKRRTGYLLGAAFGCFFCFFIAVTLGA